MKILVVCQHYYPENFQITDICEELAKKGHDVTALVGLPNYPLGYILQDYKHGKNRKETINEVNVIRCFEIGRRKNKIFLALNYLSFWLSSIFKVRTLKNDYDIVLGYETSPITMVDAGRVYAKKYNKPFYLVCADIWPECLKVYIKSENNILFGIIKKISKKIYSSATKVICTSKYFIEYLVDTHHLDNDKLVYIPQFGDDELLIEEFINTNKEMTNIVFLGNVGKEQNMPCIVKCFSELKNLNYVLHIVGDGSDYESVKRYIDNLNMQEKVILYGRKPKNEMINFYNISDICLLPLKSDNKIGYTLPNKLQNYMAAGKPILGMISGSAKEVIEEANCGLCADGNDIETFKKYAIKLISDNELRDHLGKNGREYYKKHFKKDIIINDLVNILEKK